MVWTVPTQCLEKRRENPDWKYSIYRRECSLCSSHGPPVCVCDRAITAQHGLRNSPHPPTPHTTTDLDTFYSIWLNVQENTAVMDNQTTGHDAPCSKSNYEGFLPSWFCQGVQLKCSLRWMQIHTLLVTFASQSDRNAYNVTYYASIAVY